jgi:hypothetical protein
LLSGYNIVYNIVHEYFANRRPSRADKEVRFDDLADAKATAAGSGEAASFGDAAGATAR